MWLRRDKTAPGLKINEKALMLKHLAQLSGYFSTVAIVGSIYRGDGLIAAWSLPVLLLTLAMLGYIERQGMPYLPVKLAAVIRKPTSIEVEASGRGVLVALRIVESDKLTTYFATQPGVTGKVMEGVKE